MSSERELDDGIKAIKSARRREHTARRNLEKMLENAEADNAKLRELCASLYEFAMSEYPDGTELNFADRMRELGVEVDG